MALLVTVSPHPPRKTNIGLDTTYDIYKKNQNVKNIVQRSSQLISKLGKKQQQLEQKTVEKVSKLQSLTAKLENIKKRSSKMRIRDGSHSSYTSGLGSKYSKSPSKDTSQSRV